MLTKVPLRWRVALFAALGLVTAGFLITALFIVITTHTIPIHGAPGAHRPVPGTVASPGMAFIVVTLGYVLVVIAVGLCASYLLAVHALKPVTALAGAIEATDDGHLFQRVAVSDVNDEVARLGRSFNHMMARVEQSFDQQRLFALNAAHELKTPLATIIANLEVLQLGDRPTLEEYETTLVDVLSSAQRLNDLIRDLLNLHKPLDRDRQEVVEAAPLFDRIVASLADVAAANKVRVEQCVSGLTMRGDRELLHRVFFNLVENAVKYNTPDGQVDIEGSSDEHHTVIRIRDTGIGLSEADLTRVFEPFYRVEPAPSRDQGGSGLGLSIAQSIVERHGGAVSIESRLAHGSVVTVVLPGS